MRLAELTHARVAIWGYGREGRAAVAALRRRFPVKPLTLICSAEEAAIASAVGDRALELSVGAPDAELLARYEIVVKSPGISRYRPPLPQAVAAGVRFTSGSALWFAENPHARTICVTGTKGKSTVAALITHILRQSGKCVALAGNIGVPLLELLDPPREPDWWVIELSSFQTADFAGAPTIAVINNLYEEHLDWHVTRERYAADKLAIAARAARLVVNAAQPELLARTAGHPARCVFATSAGWHVGEAAIFNGAERVLPLGAIPMRGAHNAQNLCAALTAIEATGADARALARWTTSFHPLPHRLQSLGVRADVEYVNDSISTTPYATVEALRSFGDRQVTVLVGGFDRGVDWSVFVEHAASHPPRAVVTLGANGMTIAKALGTIAAPGFELRTATDLAAALEQAQTLTAPGGLILLSPGAPSFDQFHDYAERGREFARLAGFDPRTITQIEGLGIE